jgi:hypothetical protein
MKSTTGPKFSTADQLRHDRARAYNQQRPLATWEVRRLCTLCNETFVTHVNCYDYTCDDCEEVAPDPYSDEGRAAAARVEAQRLARRSA